MKLGIVGLPNVGKSTLFNALTNAGAESANYPFCTIEPNVGVVSVPDTRLDYLADIYKPEKYTPAVVEFVDIAGLVRGASKGEGLGNKFLSNIRETDAILHVVRCFHNDNIIHVNGHIDPKDDLDTINMELIFADIELLEKRINAAEKALKGDKFLVNTLAVYHKIMEALAIGNSARTVELTRDERALLRDLNLLTMKPILYVANVAEEEAGHEPLENPDYMTVKNFAESEHSQCIAISCAVEADIAQMEAEEKTMFLEELGIKESGLDRLIVASYSLLGYISFLTAGPKEVRAWTIVKGTKAPQAAGKIHSDFERGFIRAEIVSFEDFKRLGGSMSAVKETGKLRSEGKDYVMKDGDITEFLFNV